MAKCSFAELSDRGVIKVHGSDAHRLLQDIITNDMGRARDGNAIHAALLTPQGKILFDFFLLDQGSEVLIECSRDVVPELIKRLTFYKLRADATFEDVSSAFSVWVAWGDDVAVPEDTAGYVDPRAKAMGIRIIVATGSAPALDGNEASAADYHAHRIDLGVPEGGKDYPFGDTFPHDADYDHLNGVDFKKGCYVGQEVVSRIQHRGTTRKRIVPVSGVTGLSTGTEIMAGEATIGTLGSVAGDKGLAMIRLDRAKKALDAGRLLTAGDARIRLHQPVWASFEVPTGELQS